MSHLHTDQRPRAADGPMEVLVLDLEQILGQFGASAGGNKQSAKLPESKGVRHVCSGRVGCTCSPDEHAKAQGRRVLANMSQQHSTFVSFWSRA